MSTPSTATATHPSHHNHYGYPHQQHHQQHRQPQHHRQHSFQTAGNSYAAAGTASAAPSRAGNHAYPAASSSGGSGSQQLPPLPPSSSSTASKPTSLAHQPTMTTTYQSSTILPTAHSRRKKPDWAEFYKNGVPKEIIVIDDDDDDAAAPAAPNGTSNNNSTATARRPPPSRQGAGAAGNDNALVASIAGQLAAANGDALAQPASKRRRTGMDASHDLTRYDRPTYSSIPQRFGNESSGTSTTSTDRTNSLHTTAPTSMGSHGSASATNGVYYEDAAAAGQKRKRVTTRKSARDDQKRRELEIAGDAFANYIPPPKPPIKAKDLVVPVIREHPHSKRTKTDDEDGHYVVVPKTDLTDRYEVIQLLGQGTFGKVVEAYDRKNGTKCAVKIIRSVQKYRDASRIELRVLSTLSSNDKDNRNKCIHLRDCFDFRNHICIVTDLLGPSVFDFLKANSFVPFPGSHIQNFARQLFTSVAFLHDVNLVHTDLKPENILLVNSGYQTFTYGQTIPSSSQTTSRSSETRRVLLDSEIRLIDFGSATFDDEYHSSVVSTRHYRAPEIILNLGWSFPCDIWSIGCILVEFFTGDALFQTHDNLEHLAMMESVCGGKVDTKIVKQVIQGRGSHSNSAAKYFNRYKLDYPNHETSRTSRKYVKAMKQLHEFIPANTAFNRQFLDLLRKIFVYDPKARITAKDALKHPWFKETQNDDGAEAARLRKIHRQHARA